MIKLPEPAYSGVAHSVTSGDTPSTRQRTTVIVESLPSYSAAQLKQAIRDALEEAAQLVEKSTYRKRWAKAAVNSQASNVPPCELATAIRKLKEDIQ